MTARLDEFLQELPSLGVPATMVPAYRLALEAFEASLGKAAPGRFSKYEINRFLALKQRAGASEREVRNLGTACQAYLDFCDAKQPPPPPAEAGDGAAFADLAPAAPVEQAAVMQKARLIGAGVVVLLLALVGGCIADQAYKGRKIAAYSATVRGASQRVQSRDREALKRQILEAAERHGVRVRPDRVVASVSELTPENVGRLAPDERMNAIAAMQEANIARVRALQEGMGARAPRSLQVVDLWYVEVDVIGEAPGLFGSAKFQFEHHVVGGRNPGGGR